MAILIALAVVTTAAHAEECSYATHNYHTYIQKCASIDGCMNKPRMDSLVERACGYIPDESSPGIDLGRREPPRESLVPRPRPEDCNYLSAKYEKLLGDFERYNNSGGKSSSLGDLRLDEMDWDTLMLRKRLAEQACGRTLPNRLAGADAAEESKPEYEDCDELRAIAQNELPHIWKKTLDRLAIYRDGKRNLEELRQQLLDDSFWVGEWRQLVAAIVVPLDAGGKLFENLLYVNPATAKEARLLTAARKTPQVILRLLESGKSIYKLTTEELEQAYTEILADMAKQTSPTTAAMKAVWDLSNDIATIATMPEDFSSTRRELAKQIANLNRQLDKLDQKIKNHAIALQTIDNIRTAIELYCASHDPGMRVAGEQEIGLRE